MNGLYLLQLNKYSHFGFVQYFRKFIRNFGAIVELLYKLTRKNDSFAWTDLY